MAKSQRFAKVEVDDEDPEDVLARKIVVESQNMTLVILLIPKPGNKLVLYCLGLFQSSYPVSNGEVTESSLSLSQSIQHITSGWNQTTLGLEVKLHHKIGSRKLIDILHDHGYTTTS